MSRKTQPLSQEEIQQEIGKAECLRKQSFKKWELYEAEYYHGYIVALRMIQLRGVLPITTPDTSSS